MAREKERRQYINFAFYKIDPAWRRLPATEREAGKREFLAVYEDFSDRLLLVSYSLVGIRPEAEFMIWRIGPPATGLELFQEMSGRILKSGLGRYLHTPYSYLSMTRRSIYLREHRHAGQEDARLEIVPGRARYLFVYPFVKSRDWYMLPMHIRQRMMNEHIEIGHKYPSVKIHTTYSFGLDDQEFVLAFESDSPEDFLDLVMELRESLASKYTVRDTPIFTCVARPIADILDSLG